MLLFSLVIPAYTGDSLRDVSCLDALQAGQVRDGAGELEDAVVDAGAALHLAYGNTEQLASDLVYRVEAARLRRPHTDADGQFHAGQPRYLPRLRRLHPSPDGDGRLAVMFIPYASAAINTRINWN
jgi:hypothetical protein